MKNSFYIDLQRFMLIPTKFPLTRFLRICASVGGAAAMSSSAAMINVFLYFRFMSSFVFFLFLIT